MMATKKYRIRARIVDEASQRGVTGVTVEAWDKDLIFDDLLDSKVTDDQGRIRWTL